MITGQKAIVENESVKLLWDMRIQTDRELAHNKPDIIVFNKDKRTCLIIDVTCPFDHRVPEGEREKIDRYDELKWELKRIQNCREIKIVPIVIGAFGTISRRFHSWLTQISQDLHFDLLQKACLLGTARILRHVLNI
ncbi:uncharacterized protein LOC125032877 [Penaeus chinensis]|uniref:uncharacterized protein LOC125032877 n=1 Tax=Penaeus chinensis TaxID=139456 RepID=UPI001FB800D4|nr:uncharacterized protein LOC125032877 [Penaeus chinensis]